MKTGFTILFILNTAAIILLTYFTLFEIEHHAQKIIIILLIILIAVSIFIFFRLYFNYMSGPVKSGNLDTKKERS